MSRGSVGVSPDFSLNVLPEGESVEVFGTDLNLQDATASEVANRIAIGWRKFWALKPLLMNRTVSRNKRLRLFDTTVGSSVLYGSHAWTPRTDEVAQLQTAQNRMLRRICCLPRRPDESWLDWIRRTTHSSRQLANQAGVRDWVFAHAKKNGYGRDM